MNATVPAIDLHKPLDVGNGVVAASFAGDGSWLSIGRPHPRHGFVELCGLPAFDERWRGDAGAVRRYRAWMADERFAFLRFAVAGEAESARQAGIGAFDRPVWFRAGDGWRSSSTTWGRALGPVVVQRHVIEWDPGSGGEAAGVGGHTELRFRGGLVRSAMGEITEINPLTLVRTGTQVRVRGTSLHLRAASLDTAAVIRVTGRPRIPGRWRLGPGGTASLAVGQGGDQPGRRILFVSVLLAVGSPSVEAGQEEG